MEWLFAGLFALGMLIGSFVFLIRKVIKLGPLAKTWQDLVAKLADASAKAPEIERISGSLGDDPALHFARRLELKRQARKLKRERSRRLRSRVF
ncbi:unannotated protein [freshwater metagenome]|uniref:Unannotated protein n=1 Tax=freshwater metagenome TaxID=449393 RepID=A0A6J6IWM4_9ZZZZ|nr:hypothetical protein [Actinomycetota bacterium]